MTQTLEPVAKPKRKSKAQLRREIKNVVDSMTLKRLRIVSELVRCIDELESREEDDEAANSPGLMRAIEQGERDIAEGRGTRVEDLERKY